MNTRRQRGFTLLETLVALGAEVRKVLKAGPYKDFATTLDAAWAALAPKAAPDAEKRAALDREVAALREVLATFPLARTKPFFATRAASERPSTISSM